jgi:diguanylate cyclase (GGDEF)-like protein
VALNALPLIRAISYELVPHSHRRDPEVFRRANRMVAFSLAMLLWVPVFAIIYIVLGSPICSNIILSGGTLLLGTLMLLRRGVSPEVCGNLLTGAAWYVYTALAVLTGGLSAPVMVWLATLPILSVLLSGNRAGAYWTSVATATVASFAVVQEAGWALPIAVSPAGMRFLYFTGLVGLLLCVYLLVSVLKKMEFGARQALHAANCQLERQAMTDALTGIPNRHRFEQVLEQEWARHERAGLPLSIALVDADYFKAFNDEYGHLAGDECLRMVAATIQTSIRRPGDFCARFGGEEFVIIQPDTDSQGALRVAEIIQSCVRALGIPHARSAVSPNVSISIGVSTTIPSRDRSHLDFLNDVDMALYRAKEDGRDRIVQVTATVAEATW